MAGLYKPTYLAKDAHGNRTVKRKSRKWYGWFTDRSGKKHRVPLCMDKTAAQAMLGELIRRAEREEAGLLDPFEDHRKRPLAEHLAEFEADLRAREVTCKQLKLKVFRIRRLLESCGFSVIADLSA